MKEKGEYKFDAFISYRRSDGSDAARWLRNKFQSYHLPPELREGRKEKLNIYLDAIYEKPSEDFWESTIAPALSDSAHLVLIATPEAYDRQSDGEVDWLKREIDYFISIHGINRVIIVLAKGNFDDPLPNGLKEKYPNIEIIDMRSLSSLFSRWTSSSLLQDRLRTIISSLQHVSREQMPLLRKEDARRRKRRIIINTIIGLLVFSLLGFALFQRKQNTLQKIADERKLKETKLKNANRAITLFQAEQTLEDAPGKTVAVAFATKNFGYSASAVSLVKKAIPLFPEYQILTTEERKPILAFEGYSKSFFGLESMTFAHSGDVLLVHHIEGFKVIEHKDSNGSFGGMSTELGRPGILSVWNITNGLKKSVLGDNLVGVKSYCLHDTYPNKLFVLMQNGNLETYRLRHDGMISDRKEITGIYDGITSEAGLNRLLAWTKEGKVYHLESDSVLELIWDASFPIAQTSLDRSGNIVAALGLDGSLELFDLREQRVILSTVSHVQNAEKPSFNVTWMRDKTYVSLLAKNECIVVGRRLGDKIELEVIDLRDGSSAWQWRGKGLFSTDTFGEKIAVLEHGKIIQWRLSRISGEENYASRLNIERDEWPLINADEYAGDAQAIVYGPSGEYLLTSNAPSYHGGGTLPGTLRIWYANPYTDDRAGDPHRGVFVGSRKNVPLNLAIDYQGDRFATFFADGKIRVYDIFPEREIDLQRKTDDAVDNIYHLPIPNRFLLTEEYKSPNDFFKSAESLFALRLSDEEQKALTEKLEGMDPLVTLFPEDVRDVPPSITINPKGMRDEQPNLLRMLHPSFSAVKSNYDPFKDNNLLLELIDDINEKKINDPQIIRRYLMAAEKDVLLLTGIQKSYLLDGLTSDDKDRQLKCIVGLGLTGDKMMISELKKQMKVMSDKELEKTLNWSIGFLERNGKDLSLSAAESLASDWNLGIPLLYAPVEKYESIRLKSLLSAPWDGRIWEVLVDLLQNENYSKTFGFLGAMRHYIDYEAEMEMSGLMRDLERSNNKDRKAQRLIKIKRDLEFCWRLQNYDLFNEAVSWYRMMLKGLSEKSEDIPEVRKHYRHALIRNGDYDKYLKYVEKTFDKEEVEGWTERILAGVLDQMKKTELALSYAKVSIEKSKAQFKEAKNSMSKDDYEDFYARLSPHVFKTYLLLANLIIQEASQGKEVSGFLNVFESDTFRLEDPLRPVVLNTIAKAYATVDEYTTAIKFNQHAIKNLNPFITGELKTYKNEIELWSEEIKNLDDAYLNEKNKKENQQNRKNDKNLASIFQDTYWWNKSFSYQSSEVEPVIIHLRSDGTFGHRIKSEAFNYQPFNQWLVSEGNLMIFWSGSAKEVFLVEGVNKDKFAGRSYGKYTNRVALSRLENESQITVKQGKEIGIVDSN